MRCSLFVWSTQNKLHVLMLWCVNGFESVSKCKDIESDNIRWENIFLFFLLFHRYFLFQYDDWSLVTKSEKKNENSQKKKSYFSIKMYEKGEKKISNSYIGNKVFFSNHLTENDKERNSEWVCLRYYFFIITIYSYSLRIFLEPCSNHSINFETLFSTSFLLLQVTATTVLICSCKQATMRESLRYSLFTAQTLYNWKFEWIVHHYGKWN